MKPKPLSYMGEYIVGNVLDNIAIELEPEERHVKKPLDAQPGPTQEQIDESLKKYWDREFYGRPIEDYEKSEHYHDPDRNRPTDSSSDPSAEQSSPQASSPSPSWWTFAWTSSLWSWAMLKRGDWPRGS